jgi:formiminoglutamate deiminase
VVPALVNAHSHVFHRALRGRVATGGDFWSWRTAMYDVVDRLDPDDLEQLATATYAEMLAAGITAVGEFHYVHHGPGGVPYGDRNEMSMALVRAAANAGIRLCLLDTCYLTAGVGGSPLVGPQLRFGDGDVDGWNDRHGELVARLLRTDVIVGSAIHSVRAVPPGGFEAVSATSGPTHVHASEQPAENAACLERYGVSPVRLLADHGGLDDHTTVVHAVHVSEGDLTSIASAGSSVCVCPTTELDLGDGTADVHAMRAAGIDVSLGSDSHVAIDLFAEARMVEWNDRARQGRRGVHSLAALWEMASAAGARSLGIDSWGLVAGAPADFVVVDLNRTSVAGIGGAGSLLVGAAPSDVSATVVAGEVVCQGDEHRTLGSVPSVLASVLREVAA